MSSKATQTRIVPVQKRERENDGKAIEPPRQLSSFTVSLTRQARSFVLISKVCFAQR